jgi:hypothetical protein
MPLTMHSILASLLAIIVCGGTGGFLAWAFVSWLGIDGVPGALLAAFIGTLIATAVFIAIVTLAPARGRNK